MKMLVVLDRLGYNGNALENRQATKRQHTMAHFICESNLAYYLINCGEFTQTVNGDTLTVTLDKERSQVVISVNDAICEPLAVKAGMIEQFYTDKKAGILYTPKSDYRLFVRIITDCVTGFCRKHNLPFTGIIQL